MLCIQDELGQLSLQKPSADPVKVAINIPGAMCNNDSSPETPQPAYAHKQGWMWVGGIFGCLRPVLSIIGKAGVNEIKGNQGKSATDEQNEANFIGVFFCF